MALLSTYPYLGASMMLLTLAALAVLAWPQRRWELLLAGLLCAPFACFSFEFIPQYWQPKVVAYFTVASPEDVLFSFAGGVLGWWAAAWPHRARLTLRLDARTLLKRYLGWGALGVGVGYLLKYSVPNPQVMLSTLAGMATVGVSLMWIKRRLWPLSLSCIVGYGGVYIGVMFAAQALWPQFITQWTPGSQLARDFFGMPLFEVVWAVGFGAVWPLFIGHVFDAELQPLVGPDSAPAN